jgi:hypothetical protein
VPPSAIEEEVRDIDTENERRGLEAPPPANILLGWESVPRPGVRLRRMGGGARSPSTPPSTYSEGMFATEPGGGGASDEGRGGKLAANTAAARVGAAATAPVGGEMINVVAEAADAADDEPDGEEEVTEIIKSGGGATIGVRSTLARGESAWGGVGGSTGSSSSASSSSGSRDTSN